MLLGRVWGRDVMSSERKQKPKQKEKKQEKNSPRLCNISDTEAKNVKSFKGIYSTSTQVLSVNLQNNWAYAKMRLGTNGLNSNKSN